jgi:hypothetical protein
MGQSTRFYTKAITSAITINEADNVEQVSIYVVSGTCSVAGNFFFENDAPGPISLSAGQSLTLSGKAGAPIDGITLTPAGGTTNVIMGF